MSPIPQITNPVAGSRNYGSLTEKNLSGTHEPFELVNIAAPELIKGIGQKDAHGKNTGFAAEKKEFLPMSVRIAKDPTMAVESLKQLINSDLLALAKANGYTELYGELDSLMKAIFLEPENILNEILAQEKQNTSFGNEPLFALLRDAVKLGVKYNDREMLGAVGNFLKAINFAESKNEILSALSSNMKFLSQYFAPNKAISETLASLSAKWSAENAPEFYNELKSETLSVLSVMHGSLLNNERTEVLIPLIIHNLSRYNTNAAVIPEYFSLILNHIPSENMRGELTTAFDKYIRTLFPEAFDKNTRDAVSENSSPTRNTAGYGVPEALGARLSDEDYLAGTDRSFNTLNAPLRAFLLGKTDGITAIRLTLETLISEPALLGQFEQEFSSVTQQRNLDQMIDYLNEFLKYIPDEEIRHILYSNLSELVNKIAGDGERDAETTAKNSAANLTGDSDNSGSFRAETKDLTEIIRRSIETADSEKGSALNKLVEFVGKNIDHAALKTINNYNASNLLQSLINAPGVFTPLTHYIIPIQVADTRAFGELWVDSEQHNTSSYDGVKRCHLFLTFDIDAVGRFEAEVASADKDLTIALYHPPSFTGKTAALTSKINRLAAASGYVTKAFKTASLKKPRSLTQVFPHILENRKNYDIRA